MKRPTGITVLAIVYILLGVFSLLWSGLVFGVGGLTSMFGSLFGAENVAAFGGSNAWSGALGIIAAVVQMVVAFGLLAMKKWAWTLALIGVGLTIVQGAAGMIGGGFFGFMCGGIALIIPIIILFYLLSKGTQKAFGVGEG
jgi:hypothetical protein